MDAARQTAEFPAEKLTGSNGCLLARWRDGDAALPGKLDDYAFYAYGLLELYGATFDAPYLSRAAAQALFTKEYLFPRRGSGIIYARAESAPNLWTASRN